MTRRSSMTPRAILVLGGGLAFSCVAVFARTAVAGNINLSISSSTEVTGDKLTAKLSVLNSGDEAAKAVAPGLRFGEQRVGGVTRPSLLPRETMEEALGVNVSSLRPGRWPLIITVDYVDTNGYPFQAMHAALADLGSVPPGTIAVQDLRVAPVVGEGEIQFRLNNLVAADRTVTVSIAVPKGIDIIPSRQEVHLKASGERLVSATAVNRTALVGSRYPIFVSVSYEDEAGHQSVLAQGTVEVHAAPSVLQSRRWLSWGLAAAIVLGWLSYLAWRTAARRGRGAVQRP